MTAPIQFPSISPPQVVRAERPLDGFAELLVAVQGQRAERAARLKQLALEERRVASAENLDKFQIDEIKRKTELERNELEAEEAAERYVAEAVIDPDLTPDKLSAIRARMITENKKIAPWISKAFDTQFSARQSTLKSVADRRTAETTARVAGATADNTIAQSATDRARSATEAQRAQVELALSQDVQNYGQRGHLFAQFLQVPGTTAATAARLAGMPLPKGVPPDFMFPAKPGESNAQTDVLLANMELANTAIDAAKDPGLKGAAWTQLTKSTIMGIPSALLTDPLMSDDQKALVSAYSALILPLNKLMSGARASDLDLTTARQTIVTRAGDGEKTRAQKALLRQMLPIVFAAQERGEPVSAAMRDVLDRAEAAGMDKKLLAPYRKAQRRYEAQEGKSGTGRSGGVGASPHNRAAAPPMDPAIARVLSQQGRRP